VLEVFRLGGSTVEIVAASGHDRLFLMHFGVAVIVQKLPSNAVALGSVAMVKDGKRISQWQLACSPSTHMVYACNMKFTELCTLRGSTVIHRIKGTGVKSFFHAIPYMGQECVSVWVIDVLNAYKFSELPTSEMSEEAAVAAMVSLPPVELCPALSYARFKLPECREVVLPYVAEWVRLDIPRKVELLWVCEGVKHVRIVADGKLFVHLPDTAVSCHIARTSNSIDPPADVELSIAPRIAETWAYWSAVWGKRYAINDGFIRTPDGAVTVRR
jgi:hypothetical protein